MKIVISPGYGSGWGTWNDPEVAEIMMTHPPLIAALERDAPQDYIDLVVSDMDASIRYTLGEHIHVFTAAKDSLKVVEISPRRLVDFVEVHDGYERLK